MSFAFWRRDDVCAAVSYSLFGKLRHRADFVRINASNAVACEYDQLLAAAVDRLTRDTGWEGAYDATRHAFFAYRSSDGSGWLIGCQCSSRDSGGRRFPLVAGLTFSASSIGADVALIPLTHEIFFDSLLDSLHKAIESSPDALNCKRYLESFSQTINQTGTDLKFGKNLFENHLANHCASDLQVLLQSAYPHAHLPQALLNIGFYANFIRHFPSPLTAQEIVLPIPMRPAEGTLFASLWLDLVAKLAGSPRRIAGFYFRDDFIVIAIDTFSANFSPLLPLTHPIKLRGMVLSSEHETWVSHPLYSEISYATERLFSDPAVSLRVLLDSAKQVGQRIHQFP